MRRAPLPVLLFLASLTTAPSFAECPPSIDEIWGHAGNDAGEFEGPYGIRSDQNSNLYVADIRNNRIQKFSSGGSFLTEWGSFGAAAGQFNAPVTTCIDNQGYVYVTDSSNNRIQKFTDTGTFVLMWGTLGSGSGQLRAPRGVTADGLGNVYVADTGNSRIQKFTDTGVFLGGWNTSGQPYDLDLSPTGDLWTLFHDSHRVVRYSPTGQILTQWGSFGSACNQMNHPFGLDVDAAGNVFVADSENNRIQKFTSSGQIVVLWGTLGSGSSQFRFPRGVCVNPQGEIFAADTFNDRIQKFLPVAGTCDPCPPPPPPPPPPQAGPRILVHLGSITVKNPCAVGMIGDCATAVTKGLTGGSSYYYAYLLAVRDVTMDDLSGVQCGISYENGQASDRENGQKLDIFGWTLCASLEFITMSGNVWPAPGGGNLITWDRVNRCQTGGTAVAGYFYLGAYSPDRLRVTVRPVDNAAKVATCEGGERTVSLNGLGYASFSAGAVDPGCNPCLTTCEQPIPVEPATWGSIKALYGR